MRKVQIDFESNRSETTWNKKLSRVFMKIIFQALDK